MNTVEHIYYQRMAEQMRAEGIDITAQELYLENLRQIEATDRNRRVDFQRRLLEKETVKPKRGTNRMKGKKRVKK